MQSTAKQLINIAPTTPRNHPSSASSSRRLPPACLLSLSPSIHLSLSLSLSHLTPNGAERTHPHNKFLTHLFRSITLHPRWPPRSSLIGWGKGWSQGSVRGLGDPRGEETKRGSKGERKRRIGRRGWKQ